MAFDKYFGFDLIQRETLKKLLAEVVAETGSAQAVANLNAWATATATKLNAQFAAANAETTLPFSPALAVDYDTSPQS